MGIEIECTRCEYEWEYSGQMAKATCPNCGAKVKTGIPVRSAPDESPQQQSSEIDNKKSLRERKVEALENGVDALNRIAEALEEESE